ncbi:response regulator [Hyalangium gracile]|uniref:response regulator n=1 Tax=Hyalangium gracile TaxID=394092 RepID=UPI001CCC3426|nr:response regulator [Hyalangium gracile]
MSSSESTRRILVIDDSEAIHRDFRRILCPPRLDRSADLDLMEEVLFGAAQAISTPVSPMFELDSAFQGQEAIAKVQHAMNTGRPYSMVFLDYRMPPGWNGIQTLRHLRKIAPELRVVLCSAYSDYSWEEVLQEFGDLPQLRELRKPFNGHELRRLAQTLTPDMAPAPAA